jgi:hypothetical protein
MLAFLFVRFRCRSALVGILKVGDGSEKGSDWSQTFPGAPQFDEEDQAAKQQLDAWMAQPITCGFESGNRDKETSTGGIWHGIREAKANSTMRC